MAERCWFACAIQTPSQKQCPWAEFHIITWWLWPTRDFMFQTVVIQWKFQTLFRTVLHDVESKTFFSPSFSPSPPSIHDWQWCLRVSDGQVQLHLTSVESGPVGAPKKGIYKDPQPYKLKLKPGDTASYICNQKHLKLENGTTCVVKFVDFDSKTIRPNSRHFSATDGRETGGVITPREITTASKSWKNNLNHLKLRCPFENVMVRYKKNDNGSCNL